MLGTIFYSFDSIDDVEYLTTVLLTVNLSKLANKFLACPIYHVDDQLCHKPELAYTLITTIGTNDEINILNFKSVKRIDVTSYFSFQLLPPVHLLSNNPSFLFVVLRLRE